MGDWALSVASALRDRGAQSGIHRTSNQTKNMPNEVYSYSNPLVLSQKQVGALVKRLFPNYKGRKYSLITLEEKTLDGTYWDSGSRSYYVGLNLATGQVGHLTLNTNPPQFGGKAEGTVVPLTRELAIVEHRFFGQYQRIVFYVHPDALPKFLTQ